MFTDNGGNNMVMPVGPMNGYGNDGYSGDGKEEMRRHLEMALNTATTESERQNLRNMLDSMM